MNSKFFLIGLPGAGKTTGGKQLAKKLGIPFVDLDKLIEQKEGLAIPQIFDTLGEEKFREIEALVLRDYTNTNEVFVMACGGGTPCFNANMDFMNTCGTTIYLHQPVYHIAERLKAGKESRPLLANIPDDGLENHVRGLLLTREPFYLQARLVINHTTGLTEKLSTIKSVL